MDALPVLSPEGFLTNKDVMMVKLYEYFLSSEYTQTNLFFGEIASLKYIIAEAKDSNDLRNMCREALTKMYSKYYKTVAIDVTILDTESTYHISVDIKTIDYEDNHHNLSKTIDVTDNKIKGYDSKQENYYV